MYVDLLLGKPTRIKRSMLRKIMPLNIGSKRKENLLNQENTLRKSLIRSFLTINKSFARKAKRIAGVGSVMKKDTTQTSALTGKSMTARLKCLNKYIH